MGISLRIIIFAVFAAAVFYGLGYFLEIPILLSIGSGCVIVAALVLISWVFTLLFPNVFSAKKKENETNN